MKIYFFVAASLFSMAVGAQSQSNLLTYRMSDPFLFCTHGQQDPTKCWSPIPPYTGGAAFVYSPWCEPINPYGKPWTQDDILSMEQYQMICPQGIKPGGWGGKGSPDMVPTMH